MSDAASFPLNRQKCEIADLTSRSAPGIKRQREEELLLAVELSHDTKHLLCNELDTELNLPSSPRRVESDGESDNESDMSWPDAHDEDHDTPYKRTKLSAEPEAKPAWFYDTPTEIHCWHKMMDQTIPAWMQKVMHDRLAKSRLNPTRKC